MKLTQKMEVFITKKVSNETNDQIIKVFFIIRKQIVYVEPADTKIVCRNSIFYLQTN